MLRAEADCALQGALPGRERLIGQAVDQVKVDVGETGLARRGDRDLHVVCAVDTAQEVQLGLIEALHAHAQPVDSQRAQRCEACHVHRAGVGLAGDLGVGEDIERPAAGCHDLRQQIGRQHGRCAAAQKDGSDRWMPVDFARQLDFFDQRGGERLKQPVQPRVGVEIAVGTFALAEGDVDVKGNWRHGMV